MLFKKLIHGVIPSILLTLAVGSIYAFSLFVEPISAFVGCSREQVQIAFSLGIFFLGMGAAFFGPLVEKNIKASTVLGTVLFIVGLCVTELAVHLKNIWLLYLGYGGIVGTATGIIYISPVKTMMLWFKKNPGVASAISIVSFGFGTSLCGLLYNWLYPIYGISSLFYALAGVYACMMAVGSFLLKKPKTGLQEAFDRDNVKKFSKWTFIKTEPWGRRAWLFMFLNISAGLSLIGCAASILKQIGYSDGAIVLVVSIMGVTNTLGRFLFAWFGDLLKDKKLLLWKVIPVLSIFCLLPCLVSMDAMAVALILIPALYGAGFSTCPSILANKYGMKNISTIHGLVLSAWGFAGLVGNQIGAQLFRFTGSYVALPFILVFIHSIVYLNSNKMLKQEQTK